jgi:hypothetical protein
MMRRRNVKCAVLGSAFSLGSVATTFSVFRGFPTILAAQHKQITIPYPLLCML